MKRIISSILLLFLAVSICACKPSITNSNDEVAEKVSEFSVSFNNKLQEAFPASLEIKTPISKAEGRDFIIIYELDSSAEMKSSEEWAKLAQYYGSIHYPHYEELLAFVGDDSVRLVIEYRTADGVAFLQHIIDKTYEPYSTSDPLPVVPFPDDEADEIVDEDLDALEAEIAKYCNDNNDRLIEEYSELFDGATGPNCYVDGLFLVLEYRYTKDITRQQFFEAFFEIKDEIISELKPLQQELTVAVGSDDAGLIIRWFYADGEKISEYPIGGLSAIFELEPDV